MSKTSKYGASSSILVLDYVPQYGKFKVVRRIEVPRAEYSFDKAVQLIIEVNKIYDPAWIYCDRGSGEYQIEMLHKYGDEHPESGLKNKVKGFQFSQKIPVMDPVRHTIEDKPMKPFMVNQLTMCIEREQLILSPFDELLHKQLTDYEVVRISANGQPVYTDVNEHFVDALGLAFLAFALEFSELTKTIQKVDFTTSAKTADNPLTGTINKVAQSIKKGFSSITSPFSMKNGSISYKDSMDTSDGDQPKWFEVPASYFQRGGAGGGWGSRFSNRRTLIGQRGNIDERKMF